MILWNQHKDFSSAFLEKHHAYVLCDIFHQIKAFLLFPPNCSCAPFCSCEELRENAALSLNTALFNQVLENEDDPDTLYPIRLLLRIPEDSFFREHYEEAYPLWLIMEELQKREAENHFKIVDQLMWTLLRLAQTYEEMYRVPRVSLNEGVEKILGKLPLKAKAAELQKDDRLCGAKGYSLYFNKYKSVCHFIS